MKKETKVLLLNLEPFAEEHQTEIQLLINKLTKIKEQKLPQIFEDKLKTIKNNPIDEPEIDMLKKELDKQVLAGDIDETESLLELVGAIYDAKDISADTNINDVITLGARLTDHVFGHKYINEKKEEVFKEPKSHEEFKPLAYIQKKEVRKLIVSLQNSYSEIKESYLNIKKSESNKDDNIATLILESEKLVENTNTKMEDNRKRILGMSDLATTNMSEWEIELLYQKIIANANGSYTPPMGKN